jgi:hypothetical protein
MIAAITDLLKDILQTHMVTPIEIIDLIKDILQKT